MENEKNTQHLFSNKMLISLLVPLILEQLLNSLMGTIDTMMVSNVGSAAISAVSLVDSINILVIQAFAALAAGGAIICAQYMGQKNYKKGTVAAKQVLFIVTFISIIVTIICLIFQGPMLRAIFGEVEDAVMEASKTYFFFTALSFPFIAIYDVGASVFRAQENSKGPMLISFISNIMNVGCNAILIWGFHLGVAGAAIATLASRMFCAIVVIYQLRNEKYPISVRNYFQIRPEWKTIKKILTLAIPSGVENSMFQLGKLAIQSVVSTLGTVAIAAQAMTNMLENLNGVAAVGVGIGLMTVVGECLGAGRKDEAVYYMKKLSLIAEVVMITSCLVTLVLAKPVVIIGGMDPESARMCLNMIFWITIFKPLVWVPSFIPAYGMRAAGDVRFSMIVSCASMWICRYCLCSFLIRYMGFGVIAVWIGMFTDWGVRGMIFIRRFLSKKWLAYKVI